MAATPVSHILCIVFKKSFVHDSVQGVKRERESGLKKKFEIYFEKELYELKECDFYEYGMIR